MPINYEFVFESQGARLERTIKRLYVLVLVLIVSLFLTNAGWLMYESQFKVTTTTQIDAEQEADGFGNNYIIGGDYGETEGNDN